MRITLLALKEDTHDLLPGAREWNPRKGDPQADRPLRQSKARRKSDLPLPRDELCDFLTGAGRSSISEDMATSGPREFGLSIRATSAGGMADDVGEVEFVARSRVAGRGQRLHERSRFRRVNGQWFYVDGTFPGKRPA